MILAQLIVEVTRRSQGDSSTNVDFSARARKWLCRLNSMCSYRKYSMEEMLFIENDSFGSLDFETGDVVRVNDGHSNGALAVVSMSWDKITNPVSNVKVIMASTGRPAEFPWRQVTHEKIPEELLQVARAQLKAQSYDCETAD